MSDPLFGFGIRPKIINVLDQAVWPFGLYIPTASIFEFFALKCWLRPEIDHRIEHVPDLGESAKRKSEITFQNDAFVFFSDVFNAVGRIAWLPFRNRDKVSDFIGTWRTRPEYPRLKLDELTDTEFMVHGLTFPVLRIGNASLSWADVIFVLMEEASDLRSQGRRLQ